MSHLLHTQNRLVAPVVPNSCLVLPGLRQLHLSSVWREIGQHNLSDIGEGIKKVTVNRFVNNLYIWKNSLTNRCSSRSGCEDTVAQFNNICKVENNKSGVTITSKYD